MPVRVRVDESGSVPVDASSAASDVTRSAAFLPSISGAALGWKNVKFSSDKIEAATFRLSIS